MNLPANIRSINGSNSVACFRSPVSSLIGSLHAMLEIPVVDQTGVKGLYDFKFTWDNSDQTQIKENIKQALYNQLGLELVSTNMPIEMLIVEKSN
jgi:uncharacterized protein (TIGR03435 family)